MGEDSAERPDDLEQPPSPEAVDETMGIIQEEIINTPITSENVKSFATRYTQYSKKQIDNLLVEQPQLKVMRGFSSLLGEFLEQAEKGDHSNVARFLRSEKEKLMSGGQGPEYVRLNTLGNKLGEIAQVLSPQPSPGPGAGPQGTPVPS